MSTPNPFAQAAPVAPAVAPVAPVAAAPVAEAPAAVDASAPAVEKTKKAKGDRKPRENNNKKMEDADRIAIIKRYQSEDIGAIAASMGYTRSQAYNVVRNTRLLLEEEVEKNPNMLPERRAQIDKTLELVRGKEFGKGATAGASKTSEEKVNDILAALLA